MMNVVDEGGEPAWNAAYGNEMHLRILNLDVIPSSNWSVLDVNVLVLNLRWMERPEWVYFGGQRVKSQGCP